MRPLPGWIVSWWLLHGCGHGEICDNSTDDDGDGFVDCSDQDCFASCGERCGNLVDDDGDGLVDCLDDDCAAACTPAGGGPEDCTNGIDDDLDWIVDCADDDCRAVCDADGDGWIAASMGGLDCDDTRYDVHPEGGEVPYDGLDNDCDETTPDDDTDGDGWLLADDCDDSDAASYPGAPETCGDGVINDCDASSPPPRSSCFADRSITTADATLLGTAADDWTGYAVAGAGDVNADGHADLLVGAYGEGSDHTGAAYLVMGPVAGDFDLSRAQIKWTGESEDDWAGFAVAAGGDLTGNGLLDVLIGARYDDGTGHNAGAAYVVRIDQAGTVELSDAVAKIYAEAEYDSAGYSVAVPGDVDGDGAADLLIGAISNSTTGLEAGAAYVVFGPVLGPVQLEHATYTLRGEASRDNAGCAVSGGGDLDGDGLMDLVVGACLSDRSHPNGGAAFQFSTHTLGDRSLGEADGALVGEASGDQLGTAVASAGDVDGDGLADLLISAPLHDRPGEDAGAVYLVSGPATTAMNTPTAKLYGEAAGDRAGTSVAGLGDVDGDGLSDVAIGAPGRDSAGEDAGSVYLLFGPLAGSIDLADAALELTGAAAFDFTGQSVAGAGDVDADGFPDLLIGTPFHDGAAPSGGAARLFTFGL
ncbi:MAG TPA: hypothetical protein ENK18_18330 [Deltaproteobacteria bacterium]|nr:hypothetical protein [Deltaproteobacteria bacterium]